MNNGTLPPMAEVRARTLLHQREQDVRAVARTIRLAEAAAMDRDTLLALGQLLNLATDRRDALQRAQHQAAQA